MNVYSCQTRGALNITLVGESYKMTGYNQVLFVRKMEERIHVMGFRMAHSRYYQAEYGDVVSLIPRDDCWPIYARDAEIISGTLESIDQWLNGLEFARNYDDMLKLNSTAKRLRKEQDIRNKDLVNILKGDFTV
jgi:hypothetical protein